jgi:diguanylate cyclase (GGDEF)-like protein/PAS domain S-box-containing protein
MLDLSPVGLILLGARGQVELANHTADRLLEPLVGERPADLLGALEPYLPGLSTRVHSLDPPSGLIVDAARLDGPGTVLALTVTRIEPGQHVLALENVTQLAASERSAMERERRFRAVVEGAHDFALYSLDLSGRVDAWNLSGFRLHGLPAGQVLGRPLTALWTHGELGAKGLEELLLEVRSKGFAQTAGWQHGAQGEPKWVELMVSAIAEPSGQITAYSVVARDSTERMRQAQELERLATTDPLTGACNRRSFLERAKADRARQLRYGTHWSLAMVDADHFKRVNDVHGHDVGDAVLVALTRACEGTIRSLDLFARLGGEEFAVLMPSTSLDAAAKLGERLRAAIQQMRVPAADGPVQITASVGVASAASGEEVAAVLQRADRALYRAKADGRNRVTADGAEA